jgi:hypothetical protein
MFKKKASSSMSPPTDTHSQTIKLMINDQVVYDSTNLGKIVSSSSTSLGADSTVYERALFYQPEGNQLPIEGKQYTFKNIYKPTESKLKLGYFNSYTFNNFKEDAFGEVYDSLRLVLEFDNNTFIFTNKQLPEGKIPTLSEYFEIEKKDQNIHNRFILFLKGIFNYHQDDKKLPNYVMKGGRLSRKANKNRKYKKNSKSKKTKYNRNKK